MPNIIARLTVLFLGCLPYSAGSYAANFRPCTPQITHNCTPGRFVACGSSARATNLSTLHARDASKCQAPAGRLLPTQWILVQFFSGPPGPLRGLKSDRCLEIALQVGECWGIDSDGDSYDCLGLCGVGCQVASDAVTTCSNWSRNCLKHDVCSYYYNSKGGAADPHCGWAFNLAAADYLQPCMTDSTCTLPNFNTRMEVCKTMPTMAKTFVG